MPLFRESKHQPLSGWVWIILSVSLSLLILIFAPKSSNGYDNELVLLLLVIPGIGFAIGVIRVAVAGAMYRQEEQNRRIIELLKQINDKTESPGQRERD